MPKFEFKDRSLKALKAAEAGKRVIYYDAAGVDGFGIRVTDKSTDSDRGSFVLVARYQKGANPTARRIGDYPAMGLAKAREIAREWREDIRQGVDPKEKEEARQRNEAQRRADTFGLIFEQFADDHLSTLRTGAVVRASVHKHVFPAWSERPIKDIRRADVLELMRQLKAKAPVGCNRVLAYLKKFFGWAVDQDILEASPAAAVKRLSKENQRDRVLSEQEIRAIWTACDRLGVFGRAFKVMLLTGQRRTEVGGMKWSELDLPQSLWMLERNRTKPDRAHSLPLSPLAAEIIEASPRINEYVFSSGRGAGAISGWGKAKERLDALAMVDGAPLPPWRLHDLRRTCATYLAKLGADRVVISKILNHAEGGVTGRYDRFRYDPQKRQALETWADLVAKTVGDCAPSSKIVILRAIGGVT